MKVLFLVFGTLLLVSQSNIFQQWMRNQTVFLSQDESPSSGKTLVWSDEFDSGVTKTNPNPNDWERQIMAGSQSGNNEWEYYTDRMDNSWLENGNLVIEAKKEAYKGYNYTSAKLATNVGWTYGYFEARAKVPKGEGFWPAIWMLPVASRYGPWPGEGEIDIMESVNSESTFPYACQTIHYGGYLMEGGSKKEDSQQAPKNNCFSMGDWDDYHTWGVDWSPEAITFYVDGKQTVSVPGTSWYSWDYPKNVHYPAPAPFDEQFHWILNFAIAGNWPGFKVDDSKLPAQLIIDYVRVYQ
mmetsp:Transcript_56527/g.64551  ORF Transcript_56527/g.64551 Transcript_56527/m.64551 type:complete len:297 (-) Transcript_56527:166-1056(-)